MHAGWCPPTCFPPPLSQSFPSHSAVLWTGNMLGAFTFTALLLPSYRLCGTAFPPPGHRDSWFMGCLNASSELGPHRLVRDLDPVTCCVRCRNEGFYIAALTSESCYCGNQLVGGAVTECCHGGPEDVTEGQRFLKLPAGSDLGNVALYRTEGPFLDRIRVSTSPHRVHAGENFALEVSGNLAGAPSKPTGIVGLAVHALSYVTVQILLTSSGGQSSQHANVQDDGSFALSSNWILDASGTYEINISVSNPLSRLSSTLHLSVLQPLPNGLTIIFFHGPLGVPSCIPFPEMNSQSVSLKAAYVGDPVTLQAYVADGPEADFNWRFSQTKREENKEGVEGRGVRTAGCLHSSVNWTFQDEGVYAVSVNASSAYGWMQETIHVVAVRPVVSDLSLSVHEDQLSAGASVSVDVQLFTTMKHLLLLNVALDGDCKDGGSRGGCSGDSDGSSCNDFESINRKKTTYRDQNNSLSQHRNSIGCHGDPFSLTPLNLSQSSSCSVHLHLNCCLPTAGGRYRLTASIFSSADPTSVLLFAVLPRVLTVYKRIRGLRPCGSWMVVVQTKSEFNLKVTSCANTMESGVVWSFSSGDAVVMKKGTEKWSVNVSLPTAGRYNVTVMAFNPISRASFHTHIIAQDPVSELFLNVPSVMTTNENHPVAFRVAAGSNVTVTLLVNSTSLYRNTHYTVGEEATLVLCFDHTGTVAVELRAENGVSFQNKSVRVWVEREQKPSPLLRGNPTRQPAASQSCSHNAVRIYSASHVYATSTHVTFLAVADVPDVLEPVAFLWYFGDSRSARTTSRTVSKRYHTPGRYDVVVRMSGVQTPLTSEVFPLVVQRAVKLNRLVHPASVLQNQTVMVSCRVNAGTDIIFLWDFGDGTTRLGESSEQHVFHRTGEYRIEVTASNLVSSASLMSHIFVVDRPCQPPPVKNMGPLKVQVRRYEVIRLGVTYETEVDCDTTRGLRYTWTMFDSVGRIFPLTLIDTHRQTLVLRSHLLHYDTYTAVARVQVVGSVVYSNYSVRVQVMPSLPVASIQGSTNIFINRRNGTTITLDGWRSYDPDYPGSTVSFSWTCDPVSSIRGSCFNQPVETSHARLTFPVNLLKNYFDQFRFTLAVRSRDFAASTETFITITSNVIGTVSVHCPQCGGDQVTWDQSFSVNASCENCGVSPEQVQYTWSLYLVNASSKPVVDVPFCFAVDLSAPSTVVESPSGWLRPPAAEASHYPQTLITGLTEPERPPPSSPATTTASGEEFLDHPQEEVEPLLSSTDPPRLGAGGVLLSQTDVISESLIDSDSSADWEFSFPALAFADAGDQSDYDAPFPVAEEGDPGVSAGRPTGVDGETLSPGDVSAFDPVSHDTEGSNLVDSSPSAVIQEPTLLDLPREPVDRGLFESYTFTGIFSPSLSFRPSSLRSGSRYMLEVTAKTPSNLLGRTQIFLKTTSSPKGMTCQVQPLKGMELYTHFSIFCTSGREDLVYEYSFSIGSRPPWILYQGRNFQYYFSLPSGDHSDEYNVTIYTRIRSSTYGTSTKLCPVTVQVRPSFVRDISLRDPDLELSESGLKNLSALVQLGNSVEIRNYISLLSSILNRLSQDARANIHIQRRIRSVLICSVCELESSEQASMVDSILILKDLLKVTSQVTLASVRRATDHVQAVSEQLSRAPVGQHLHQETLHSLVTVLSYSLQAAVTGGEESHHTDMRHPVTGSIGCMSSGVSKPSPQQLVHLTDDILQTAADLILKYILFSKLHEHQVSSGVMSFYATYLNQTSSSVISSGSTTVYLPSSLLQSILSIPPRGECVLSLLTHSSYTGAHTPGRIRGRAVELSLYKCSTRRRIPVGSLVQPVITELPRKHQSPALKYVLMRSRVNYHSFNITQEYLQQAIQLTVVFTPPSNRTFPIMLLFRMFEKPTPSMHHLQKIYHWESNTWRMTMPPSYLNAAGVGYLAVLNADFEKPLRHTHLSSQVNYTLTVESSQCLSWDHRRGAWTHLGCTTQQTDRTDSVSCSCHHLRPLTVVQQQIQIHHDTTDLDPFLSLSCNLSVLAVLLLLCVCLYIPGWLMCRRADVTSEQSLRVHYLTDNAPQHQHLYAVTTHTGVFSAPCMSAKVYMVLYGDDGVSQTRELQVPGCTLFRRNSQDTFILSAADSLGPLWGVHIWHDNSGPAPSWYLKQVEVAEVTRGYETRRTWFFLSQCWLAVDKGDGQVERMLRVFTKEIGFTQMLTLKLLDYLADFHIWISVCSLPHPSSFTHTQRLSVSLLLLSGYACVSAGIISQLEEPLPLELGITAVSAVSVTTGVLSVLAWLPPASLIAFLFRLREGKVVGSGGRRADVKKSDYDCFEDAVRVNDSIFESRLYWSNLQQWAQEAWRKKYQGADQMSASTGNLENKAAKVANPTDVVIKQEDAQATESSTFKNSFLIIDADKDVQGLHCVIESRLFNGIQGDYSCNREKEVDHRGKCPADVGFKESSREFQVVDKLRGRAVPRTWQWCHGAAWTLCLLLSLLCLVASAVLGLSFSSSEVLLWIHSLLFSLLSCIFLIQPLVIAAAAVTASLLYRHRPGFHHFRITEFQMENFKLYKPHLPQERNVEKLLGTRQRARYLRLVRPLSPADLRKTRGKKRREALIYTTLRDFCVCVSMLFLMLCVTSSSSLGDHYALNKAVRQQFIGGGERAFMSIKNHEDWWKWTQTSLLHLLYKNASTTKMFNGNQQSHVLIGEPIIGKVESSFMCKLLSSWGKALTNLPSDVIVPMETPSWTCSHLRCYQGSSTTVGLGHSKQDAVFKLKVLHAGGWLGRETVALKVQFTLYSPVPNLFTSVTLFAEQSPTGGLLPLVEVQSVRIYHSPAVWDYVVMVCQLLFLVLSLLNLCFQIYAAGQQGLMGYGKTPRNWLEVILLTITLVYYIHCIYHSAAVTEVVELLQRERVDISLLAKIEQSVRSLHGVMLFLLSVKCVINVKVTSSTALSLSSIFLPTISSLILLMAVSSLQALLPHSLDIRGLLPSGQEFYLSSTAVWTAVVIGVAPLSIRNATRPRSSKDVCTLAELCSYVRQRVCEFAGHRTPAWNNGESRTYYLEEFEGLVDELLFRLNALSNSLHHAFPPKASHFREDSPTTSLSQVPTSMDSQSLERASSTEEVSELSHPRVPSDGTAAPHPLRVPVQTHRRDDSPPESSATSDNGTNAGAKSNVLQASSNRQNVRSLPESASVMELWRTDHPVSQSVLGDIPERQTSQWTETSDTLSKSGKCGTAHTTTQATHTEVIVEVLVHEEPASGENI